MSKKSSQNHGPSIIILADAWTRSAFYEALHDGWLPEIQEILDSGGCLLPEVISGFPSVSLASHSSLLTLSAPKDHGIPGHRWVDSITEKPRNYIGHQCRHVNRDLSNSVQSVFERVAGVTTIAVGVPTSRGADMVIPMRSIRSRTILRRLARAVCRFPKSLSVAWLPNGDIVSHVHGPDSTRLLREMRQTSIGIGNLARALSAEGLWDSCRFALVTDHGHRRIGRCVNLQRHYKAMGYTVRQNPRYLGRNDVVVFTNGDSAAYVYYLGQDRSSDRLVSDTRELVKQPGLGLSFVRVDSNNHIVLSESGLCRIEVDSPSRARYRCEEGTDPIGILPGAGSSMLIDLRKPLLLSDTSGYPDIISQYLDSYVPGRSPQVLLTAARSYHFGHSPRIGWRLGFHRGSHGGPLPEEMLTAAVAKGWACEGLGPIRIQDLIATFLSESPGEP